MKRLAAAWGLAAAFAAAPAAESPTVDAGEPRAFGYQVGDLVQRRIVVHAPAGWTLDAASVPKAGLRGKAIELRRVATAVRREDGGLRHVLDLEYQVFLAPAAVRTLEIPSFRLGFDGTSRREELLVEAWPVTVAPLVPPVVSPRRGLGELQPDAPPPRLDTAHWQQRLLVTGVAALLLLAALAVVEFGPPWRAARQRPFGVAWRQLRRLPAQPSPDEWRTACRQLHDALNRSFGEVLFEAGLDRFVALRPALAAQREAIARFLQLSRREFFAAATSPREPADGAWLRSLSRQLHDAERGR